MASPSMCIIQYREMSTLKALNMRHKSLESIKKITQSMKMVAAAKFARAEQTMNKLKALSKAARGFFEKSAIKLDSEMHRQLIVYISSDRGLCGGAHSGIFKMLRCYLNNCQEDDYQLVCYGDKAKNLMKMAFKDHFMIVVSEVGKHAPVFKDAARVADKIFRSGFKYKTGKIAFNKFVAKMKIAPTTIPITNFDVLKEHITMHKYQELSREDLASFLEFLLASQLYSVMVESIAAEHCSRMLAMDGSSKSAGDMMQRLGLLYNRTRQAVITRELTEIISGASAIEKKE